jgi:hypothetical protein
MHLQCFVFTFVFAAVFPQYAIDWQVPNITIDHQISPYHGFVDWLLVNRAVLSQEWHTLDAERVSIDEFFTTNGKITHSSTSLAP